MHLVGDVAVDVKGEGGCGVAYMTDEERSVYNYHWAKGGTEAAERYLNSICGVLMEQIRLKSAE